MPIALNAVLFIVAALMCFLTLFFLQSKLHKAAAGSLGVILCFMGFWNLLSSAGVFTNLQEARASLQTSLIIPVCSMPALWLRFFFGYTCRHRITSRILTTGCLLISGLFVLSEWLIPSVSAYSNPVFWVFYILSALMVAVSLCYLVREMLGKALSVSQLVLAAGVVLFSCLPLLVMPLSLPQSLFALFYTLSCGCMLGLYKTGYFVYKMLTSEDFYDIMKDGILLLGRNGEVLEMNKAARALLGLSSDANAYEKAGQLIADWPESPSFLQKFKHPERGERNYRVITGTHDKDSVFAHTTILFINDETALYQAEKRIHYLEHFDEVTGLASRACFMDDLNVALCNHTPDKGMTVCCLSILNFNDYCSVYGRTFGEELLRKIGFVLRSAIPDSGALSRFDSDEFYLFTGYDVHRETIVQATERVASRLSDWLSKPLVVNNIPLSIRVRMGIAFFPDHAKTSDRLISMSHLAKLNAGDRLYNIYQEKMGFTLERYMRLSQHMNRDLQHNEFYLVYQPQVRIEDRRVVGVEALLRWRSPELGQVSPAEFIPVAEETGLIHKIGLWVIEQTIQRLADWKAKGIPPVRVSANVSVSQLTKPDFADKVVQMIFDAHVDPTLFELEMTESIALFPEEMTQRQIERLRAAGIRIAMDDFGMGHASLAYITHWKFDTIKIDRAFSQKILTNANANATVRSVQALCDAIGADTVAECVEYEEQVDELQKMGCSIIQGYVYSPPLSVEDCTRYIMQHNAEPPPPIKMEKVVRAQ